MKKNLILLIFLTLAISSQVMAQSKPFIGYDKAAWGITVLEVRNIYSISEDVVVDEDPNIVLLNQENVSDNITLRVFFFNCDKLYRVTVFYKNGDDANQSLLKGLLEQRYGSVTHIDSQSGSYGNVLASIPYNEKILIFGKFEPEIEVQLVQRNFGNSTGLGSSINVTYTWKKFRDEYQASKLGL